MVGKVDKLESTVKPVTVIEIGFEPLVMLFNLPNDNEPKSSPVVVLISELGTTALHLIVPVTPVLETPDT